MLFSIIPALLDLSRWAFTTALPSNPTSLTQTNALLKADMMLLSSSLEIQDNGNAVFADMTYTISTVCSILRPLCLSS